MTKIYTKVGDHGFTRQITGKIIPKDDQQLVTLGNIDELQSYLGVTRANLSAHCQQLDAQLKERQRELYLLATDVVLPQKRQINAAKVNKLEQIIDRISSQLPKIKLFILPAGKKTGANLQYARTLARRAERSLVKLKRKEERIPEDDLKFINRLSDYLFILARYANMLDHYHEQKSKENN